jgi:hypothetical protein
MFWFGLFVGLTSVFSQEALNLRGSYKSQVIKHGLHVEVFPVVISLRKKDFLPSQPPFALVCEFLWKNRRMGTRGQAFGILNFQ